MRGNTTVPSGCLTVHIAGAAGGQGTTTVATVLATLAARHRPGVLAAVRPSDVAALVGMGPTRDCEPSTEIATGLRLDRTDDAAVRSASAGAFTVVDEGRADQALPARDEDEVARWLVVRGPCYLALRTAVESGWPATGAVLLAEPGRALRAADVADVLGVPVVAEVPWDARVARAVDAGVLLSQITRLAALRPLATLAQRLWPPDLTAAHFSHDAPSDPTFPDAQPIHSTNHTDAADHNRDAPATPHRPRFDRACPPLEPSSRPPDGPTDEPAKARIE